MQDSTGDLLDLNKRQIYSGQYDLPDFPYGGMWHQLHEQEKSKQQLKLIAKYGKSKPRVGKDDSIGPQDGTTVPISKTQKIKSKVVMGW